MMKIKMEIEGESIEEMEEKILRYVIAHIEPQDFMCFFDRCGADGWEYVNELKKLSFDGENKTG